jgi:hypothetical protein
MKRSWLFLLLVVGLAATGVSRAQVSVYAEATATDLQDSPLHDWQKGATVGILVDGPKAFHRVQLSGDVRGRFVYQGDGESLNGVTLGPRLALAPKLFKLAPFVSFDVGFARYNDGRNGKTTDVILGGSGGISRRITQHFDFVADYNYEYYGFQFGYYSPQSISTGVIYHLGKR